MVDKEVIYYDMRVNVGILTYKFYLG